MALPRPQDPHSKQDWRTHYQIENPDEVEAYVTGYPITASVLAEAPDQIVAAFEENPRLVLSLEVDPDEPDSPYLTVDIMTKRDVDDAFDRLQRFDESWWLDAIQHVARADAVIVFYPRFE
jgi:hypothetical protein